MQSESLVPDLGLGFVEARPPLRRPPSLLMSHAGAAIFGVSMAFSAASSQMLPSVVTWALALPLVFTCTWVICLPALYIPWASRESQVTVTNIGRAALAGIGTFGTCLGATAPIQWFFAVTAPASRWLGALGFVFIWLALIAATTAFARVLQAQSLKLPAWAQALFFALFATTFFQFAHIAGLQFFRG